MNKKIFILSVAALVSCFVFFHCENSTEPAETRGTVSGTITGKPSTLPSIVYPAYIFLADSLVTTTDGQGAFSIPNLEQGKHVFTCSALNCRDTLLQVNILGGQTTRLDIEMIPDTTQSRVYAEFHDLFLFRQMLEDDPSLDTWTQKEMFDGVTGATIQSKTLRYEIPDRTVHLGDSLLAVTDGYAQCWFDLQIGTYPIIGKCEGYQDTTFVVHVPADNRIYINFFLDRAIVSKY